MTSPLDDALKRTAAAVDRYGAPENMIAAAAGSLTRLACAQRVGLEIDALHGAILTVADAHAGPHERCATCSAVRDSLAVAMGILRAEVEAEFAAEPGE